MNGGILYLDSSAIVKVVAREPETPQMLDLLRDWPDRASTILARVEVIRALRRLRAGRDVHHRAEQVLARVGLIGTDDTVLNRAAVIDPPALRSLDAIHLTTALSIGDDLGGIATYDGRLARAAEALGVTVMTPGRAPADL